MNGVFEQWQTGVTILTLHQNRHGNTVAVKANIPKIILVYTSYSGLFSRFPLSHVIGRSDVTASLCSQLAKPTCSRALVKHSNKPAALPLFGCLTVKKFVLNMDCSIFTVGVKYRTKKTSSSIFAQSVVPSTMSHASSRSRTTY